MKLRFVLIGPADESRNIGVIPDVYDDCESLIKHSYLSTDGFSLVGGHGSDEDACCGQEDRGPQYGP